MCTAADRSEEGEDQNVLYKDTYLDELFPFYPGVSGSETLPSHLNIITIHNL